jgi:putative RNA 2'-phosphotransferase
MDLNPISKYIAMILRHKPEEIGITLDEHGWANTNELIAGVKKKYPEFGLTHLMFIVESDEKHRYSFGDDMQLIRANQGHSIPVDLELEAVKPPEYLWHGSGQKYFELICEQGLIPKSRQYVHLSTDINTAEDVGKRHGEPVIFSVDAGQMYRDGYEFFLSENSVWLTKEVPVKYLHWEDV